MVTALLDSTVIVDFLRHYIPAIEWFESQRPKPFGVTSIVIMEILVGAPTKEKQRRAIKLLTSFEPYYLNETIRSGRSIKLAYTASVTGSA